LGRLIRIAPERVGKFCVGSHREMKMEVTKKKEREEEGQDGKKPGIDPAIIEELMKDYQRPEDLTGAGGILEQLHTSGSTSECSGRS